MIKDTTSTNVSIISCGEWSLYVEASAASVTSASESTRVQFFFKCHFFGFEEFYDKHFQLLLG
jgi:hypothetical protein